MQSLCPLNSCTSVPLQLAYATPDRLRNREENRPLFEPPKNLEAWLQCLENTFPDRRIRLQVKAYPGNPSPSRENDLNPSELKAALKQAAAALGDQIPTRKRCFFDGVYSLEREGKRVTCKARMVPRVLTAPGVRLMNRLDLTDDQERAGKIMTEFWNPQLPWLRASGIQLLEIRSNLNPLLWH